MNTEIDKWTKNFLRNLKRYTNNNRNFTSLELSSYLNSKNIQTDRETMKKIIISLKNKGIIEKNYQMVAYDDKGRTRNLWNIV